MSIQDRDLSPGISHQLGRPISLSGQQLFIVRAKSLVLQILISMLPSVKEVEYGSHRATTVRVAQEEAARQALVALRGY